MRRAVFTSKQLEKNHQLKDHNFGSEKASYKTIAKGVYFGLNRQKKKAKDDLRKDRGQQPILEDNFLDEDDDDCSVADDEDFCGSSDRFEHNSTEDNPLDCIPNFTITDDVMPPVVPSNKLSNMSFIDWVFYTKDEKSSMRALYQSGFAKFPKYCAKCKCPYRPDEWIAFNVPRKYKTRELPPGVSENRQFYRCQKCDFTFPFLYSSWIEHFKNTSFRAIALSLHCFIIDVSPHVAYRSILKGLITRSNFYYLMQYYRCVCQAHFIQRPVQFHAEKGCDCFEKDVENPIRLEKIKEQLPTFDKEIHSMNNPVKATVIKTSAVNLDEAHVGKTRKYCAGFFWQNLLIFGICSRISAFCMLCVVPNTKKKSLLPYILRHICPKTIVHTDSYVVYDRLSEMDFKHLKVNHSAMQFVDHETGASTNTIEGLWGRWKCRIADRHGLSGSVAVVEQHLNEFAYRSNFGKDEDVMKKMFSKSLRKFHRLAYQLYQEK